MKEPTIIQELDMKDEFRKIIKLEGRSAGLQVLYEILKSGEWLAEVLLEEPKK